MITLLARIFIKDRNDYKNPSVRQSYGVLCGAVGIFLNLCLFAGKMAAGLMSRSIAITADAFNNLSDAASSAITLAGFRLAGQKPDPDHPFGHGRIEYICGLLVSILILFMGFELLKSSVTKILHPEELLFSPLILIILIASIFVKCYMFLYNRGLGKKLNSSAMTVTGMDSLSDMLSTAVVLLSTLTAHFTGLSVDGWCGVLVGLFICYAGLRAARDTVNPLLGQAPDQEFVRQINDIVMSHKEIIGVHDLIVHNYGPGRILISLHAEVPADRDILTLHEVVDAAEHELKNRLSCHAVIHMDPVQVGDQETERLKDLTKKCLLEIDPVLTMHDFRIVSGANRTKLIFDVAVPYDFPMPDEALAALIDGKLKAHSPNYTAVVDIDKNTPQAAQSR